MLNAQKHCLLNQCQIPIKWITSTVRCLVSYMCDPPWLPKSWSICPCIHASELWESNTLLVEIKWGGTCFWVYCGRVSQLTITNPSWWVLKALSSSAAVVGSLGHYTHCSGPPLVPSMFAPQPEWSLLVAEFPVAASGHPHLWSYKLETCCRVLLWVFSGTGKEVFKWLISSGERGAWLTWEAWIASRWYWLHWWSIILKQWQNTIPFLEKKISNGTSHQPK